MKENPDAWKGIIKMRCKGRFPPKTLEKLEIMAATSMTTFWLMTGSTKQFYDALKGDKASPNETARHERCI